jgi:hypothetical protein
MHVLPYTFVSGMRILHANMWMHAVHRRGYEAMLAPCMLVYLER